MKIASTDQLSILSPAFSAQHSIHGKEGASTAIQVMTPQAASFLAQRNDLQHTGKNFKAWAAVQAATESSSAIKLLTRFFGDGAAIKQPEKRQSALPAHALTLAKTSFASSHRASLPELRANLPTNEQRIGASLPDLSLQHESQTFQPLAHPHFTSVHPTSQPELSQRSPVAESRISKSLPAIASPIEAAPVMEPLDVSAVLLKLSNKKVSDDDLTRLLGTLNRLLMEAPPESGVFSVAKQMSGHIKELDNRQAHRLLLALEGTLGDSARAITRFAVYEAKSAPETITPALTRLGQCNTLLKSLVSSLNSKLHQSGARFSLQTPTAKTFNQLSPLERNAYSQTLSVH